MLGWLAAFLSLVFAVPQGQVPETVKQAPEAYLEAEAYNVYSSLLPDNSIWGNWALESKSLVIQQETTRRVAGEPDCLPQGEEVRKNWKEALEDYVKQNQSSKLLRHGIPTEKPYDLVPAQEIFEVSSAGNARSADGLVTNWNALYKRYPGSGGFIQLSAVGFNADKTKALVYVAHRCGALCGAGGYMFLEKRDGKWMRARVRAANCDWIS